MKKYFLSITIIAILLVQMMEPGHAQADRNPPLIQNQFDHRYVIFLSGVNSKSSENSTPLDGKFVKLKKALESRGFTNFVYFSYSGTGLSSAGFCGGWGKEGCAEGTFGQLSALNLSPQYTEADTHNSVDMQADTLNWLIGEVIRVDSQAEIYLVGFSLGGIISSHWASRINLFDYSDHVKGIVMINSPVGGIPLAGPMLEGCNLVEFVCALWRGVLLSIYGETVLSQLQLPASNSDKSILANLPNAAKNFPMTSIQSADDYTVNGKPVPLCGNYLCTFHDDVVVGIGSQEWLGIKNLHDQPLGGIGPAKDPIRFRLSLKRLLERNHNDTLQNDQALQWAADAVAGAAPPQNPSSPEYAHRYIIFLQGITSSSSQAGPPLGGSFNNIENELRNTGIANFVYFSYAAATAVDRGKLMCTAWGNKGCANGTEDLTSLHLSPQYSAEDTKVNIDRQADALEWLVGQIIKKDAQAKIDILGFSLGGIIATRWGSRPNGSVYYDFIHGVIIMGSPVGGIPMAGTFLKGCNLTEISCQVWKKKLLSDYGEVVGAQLQLPIDDPDASIIDDLRNILKNKRFLFASIQSTDDYTVNGKLFPLCRNLACTASDGVLIGYGSQLWPAHIHYHDKSLGGLGIPTTAKNLEEFGNYLHENHSATLQHGLTAQWIIEVVTDHSKQVPKVPTVTPLPTLQAPNELYTASSGGVAYDIVQPGETAYLAFQVTNSGQSAWSGLGFKFSPVPGSKYAHLSSLSLSKAVNPGETVTFEITVPKVAGTSVETVEYQMTYQGQPFDEIIKGYIFILPEQVKDMEKELRKKIEEWKAQGKQGLQDLINSILQEIQKAVEEQAKKSIDNLLRQCLPSNGMIILAAIVVVVRRKSRHER